MSYLCTSVVFPLYGIYKSVYFTKNFPRSWHGFYGTVTSFLVEMFEVSYSKFRYNLSLLNFMYLSFSN